MPMASVLMAVGVAERLHRMASLISSSSSAAHHPYCIGDHDNGNGGEDPESAAEQQVSHIHHHSHRHHDTAMASTVPYRRKQQHQLMIKGGGSSMEVFVDAANVDTGNDCDENMVPPESVGGSGMVAVKAEYSGVEDAGFKMDAEDETKEMFRMAMQQQQQQHLHVQEGSSHLDSGSDDVAAMFRRAQQLSSNSNSSSSRLGEMI